MTIPSLGREYDEINQDMFSLQATWQIYRQLFGTNEERVQLLFELVPNFADFLRWILLDAVLLGICRLCDPAKQGKYENLTLQGLVKVLAPAPDAAQRAYFAAQLAKIDDQTKGFREHRHKRIAHSDLARSVAATELLPGISRQMVEDALREMRDLLHKINGWYGMGEVLYERVHIPGDGDTLIWWLEQANRFSELQDEAWTGKVGAEKIVEKLKVRT